MKQIVSNYSYSPTTNVVTLTGVNIEQDQLLLVVAPQVGRTMYNFASGVTGSVVAGTDTRVTLNASTVGLTTTSPLVIFYDDQLSTQTIAGTVTANLPALNWNTVKISYDEKSYYNGIYKKGDLGYVNTTGGGTPVYLPIDDKFFGGVNPVLTRSTQTGGGVTFSGTRWNFQTGTSEVEFYAATTAEDLRLVTEWYDANGEVTVSITPYSTEPVAITNPVTIGSLPAISGTVTVGAMPNGSLTTRFGSVTTANTAELTSAVTNASRKYLLIQNVTTSSNVITVGIGFTPTTTQGIQLTAGAGITFESSYIPTGAVYVLSSVTASPFTVLEA